MMNKQPSEEISFGQWLRQRRRLLDLTQQELADQAGCARITLRRIESGALKPSKELALILLKTLNVPTQEHEAWLQFARGIAGFPDSLTNALTRSPITNLPISLTSFVGRQQECNEVIQLLHKDRLVTLTGTGGIGKSRISIQAASSKLSDYPDGIWMIDLAPLSDPMLVPTTALITLGLIEQAGLSPVSVLKDFLQKKQALLILDNCEHVAEACARLVEALLRGCPGLHVLATSREALNTAGEAVYVVPPLPTPDPSHVIHKALHNYEAVELFIKRAQNAFSNFSMTPDNAPSIAKICYHLDGIPLALELAAARVKMMTVEEIAARLYDRFRLLTDGPRTAHPHHQTLRATIDWSHDLLTEPERILFRRLSMFFGGWSLESAEAVCGFEGIKADSTLDLLTQLFNKSLVIADRGQGKVTRYHMLETIREYAREKLWEAGEGEILRQRHLAYFVDLAERAEPNLRSRDMVEWLDRLETELHNNRLALTWAEEDDVQSQLRLASALLWFWHIRAHKYEGIDWLQRGLTIEAMEQGNQPLTPSRAMIRGKALNAIGYLLAVTFTEEKARAYLEESLALFQELGATDQQGMAHALLRLGGLMSAGNQGRNMLERSLILCRETGDKFGIAECLTLFVGSAQNDDDYEQALVLAEEQLALRREIGDLDGIATALGDLGSLSFFVQNDYQRAITLLEESLAGFHTVKNKWATGFYLSNYGDVCFWHGDYERATRIYEEAIAFAQDIGERLLIAANSYSLGAIAWFQGDYAGATQMITDSLVVFRDAGFHWLIASSLHALGGIALSQGDEEGAAQWYETELAYGRETQLNESIIFALDGLGKTAWSQGDYKLAEEKFKAELSMSRDANLKPIICRALYGLGRVAQSKGDNVAAHAYYIDIFKIQRRRMGFLFNWAWLKTYGFAAAYPLAALAALATAQSRMERATHLLGAAETLYIPLRFEMSARERLEHDQAIAAACLGLGDEAFAAAWTEGKAMTLEQAVAYALSED